MFELCFFTLMFLRLLLDRLNYFMASLDSFSFLVSELAQCLQNFKVRVPLSTLDFLLQKGFLINFWSFLSFLSSWAPASTDASYLRSRFIIVRSHPARLHWVVRSRMLFISLTYLTIGRIKIRSCSLEMVLFYGFNTQAYASSKYFIIFSLL